MATAMIDTAACAVALAIDRELARTLRTFRTLHDNLAAVVEAHAGARTLCAAGLRTMGAETDAKHTCKRADKDELARKS